MSDTEQQSLVKITAQINARQFNAAAKTARVAIRKFPKHPGFPNLAGLALAQAGKHREAAPFFAQALKMSPGHEELQNNLLQALVLSDQHGKFDELSARFEKNRGNSADIHYLRAMSTSRRGDDNGTVEAATAAIDADPNRPRAYELRAAAFRALGRAEEALRDFETLMQLSPDNPEPVRDMAVLLIRLFRQDEARTILLEARKRMPQSTEIHNLLGMLATMEGRTKDAIAHYEAVVRLNPEHGEAFLQLALFQDAQGNAAMLPRLGSALQSADPKSHNRALLHFARAAVRKQSKDIPGELDDLAHANRIEAALRPYDRRSADTAFRVLTSADPEPATDSNAPVPVFVLGLPRSGTTLLEQILTASDAVYGCGELPMGAGLAAQAVGGTLNAFSAPSFAAHYRSQLPEMPSGTTHFVDKLPDNYKVIGLLHAAFPNAVFLHLDRDPRAVALSMWRAYFAAPGLNYAFDQKSMAYEMNLFRRYMLHWQDKIGNPLKSLRYEQMVSDIETASREIAAVCGLEWTPAMAQPEANTRAVRTASASQVRDGVHTRSVRGWEPMAPALQTLIRGLDPVLWPDLKH